MTALQRTSISQLFDLTGKVAIVTDGALGIGQAKGDTSTLETLAHFSRHIPHRVVQSLQTRNIHAIQTVGA